MLTTVPHNYSKLFEKLIDLHKILSNIFLIGYFILKGLNIILVDYLTLKVKCTFKYFALTTVVSVLPANGAPTISAEPLINIPYPRATVKRFVSNNLHITCEQ